ncbi:hypothetical protein [Desulforegula conservatrix]|uniref:hypothetical protein n=1 Tax=Desulforegula conservatrix TaxID=153026 RepID=UPI00042016DE|nr:hypothetical protein [Desulforegula conservatrix]
MNGIRNRSYKFPTQSLPGVEISEHLKDLREIIAFLEARSISTKNTRICRYTEYLTKLTNSEPLNESLIFKNSTDGPFESSTDWYLYTLREVHELMWILKGLKKHIPKGIDEKLKLIVSGRDFATLDSNSLSRNTQFELRIASYFCQAGCYVDISGDTDIVALNKKYAFFLECKRVGNFKQLAGRLSEAKKQLNERMPRRALGRIVTGCIAADVTKIAFDHNGLTFGMTNEHSRDVIQDKLINIGNHANKMSLFDNCNNLYQYWLQIHIPSQIIYPASSITRFSSYFIYRDDIDRKGMKSVMTFRKMFENCSKGDERELPPDKLKRKTSITVPKDSTFYLDEDLLSEYLLTGKLLEKKNHDIVGKLEINGKKDEFSFLEFQILTATINDDQRRKMSKDKYNSRFQLVMEMYLLRYPYEESSA